MIEENTNNRENDESRGNWKTCPRCQGTGKIKTRYYDLAAADEEVEEACVLCDGSGKIPRQ